MSEKLPWTKVVNGITYELVGGRYVPQFDYSSCLSGNKPKAAKREYPEIKGGYAQSLLGWLAENRPWVLYDEITVDDEINDEKLQEFADWLNQVGEDLTNSYKEQRDIFIQKGYDYSSASSVANEYTQSDLNTYLSSVYTDESDPNGYSYEMTYSEDGFPVPVRKGKDEEEFDFHEWYENIYLGKDLTYGMKGIEKSEENYEHDPDLPF